MTTLELARAIADAVFYALLPGGTEPNRNDDNTQDRPTQAVLRVLHEHDSWFCRLTETPQGTHEERYGQVELFK